MIFCEAEQGTDEWLLDRLGVPTASQFGNIITATGKPSTSAPVYMYQLLADFKVGRPVDQFPPNFWMKRGTELEPDAREVYEFITDHEVEQTGFILRDDRMVGCSPDGLVGDSGMLEIKSPKASTHIGYILGGKCPPAYWQQVQGQMWIAEREWCDFMSYHPDMPVFKIRINRDDEFIDLLEKHLNNFIEKMLELRAKLEDL